jgi:Helix-turn-helix domain
MALVAAAISHPLRFRILTAMNSPERNASPKELAAEMGIDVGRVSYHMRELKDLGFLELIGTTPRNGSIEHVYKPIKRFEAFGLEWSKLLPSLKRTVASSALGLAVKSIGASIDDGKFEAREDSIIAQDTFRTDERGAEEALAIVTKALEDLLALAGDAKARLAESDEEGFLLSYVLAGFEGALRPV